MILLLPTVTTTQISTTVHFQKILHPQRPVRYVPTLETICPVHNIMHPTKSNNIYIYFLANGDYLHRTHTRARTRAVTKWYYYNASRLVRTNDGECYYCYCVVNITFRLNADDRRQTVLAVIVFKMHWKSFIWKPSDRSVRYYSPKHETVIDTIIITWIQQCNMNIISHTHTHGTYDLFYFNVQLQRQSISINI